MTLYDQSLCMAIHIVKHLCLQFCKFERKKEFILDIQEGGTSTWLFSNARHKCGMLVNLFMLCYIFETNASFQLIVFDFI